MTRPQFRTHARPLPVSVDGRDLGDMNPTEHSTGSLGYRLGGKLTVLIDGQWVELLVTVTATVPNSKQLPK